MRKGKELLQFQTKSLYWLNINFVKMCPVHKIKSLHLCGLVFRPCRYFIFFHVQSGEKTAHFEAVR